MLPEEFAAKLNAAKGLPCLLLAGAAAEASGAKKEPDPAFAEWALSDLRRSGAFDEERVGPGPDQLREAVSLAQTPSLFGTRRLVVAWQCLTLAGDGGRGTKERPAELAALEDYLEHPVAGSLLCIWAPRADRRLRPVQKAQALGALLSCGPVAGREQAAWLQELAGREGVTLSFAARAAFLQSGLDLLGLQAALRVASLAVSPGAPIPDEVAEWAAPPSAELRVFALTDAVLRRDRAELLGASARLLAQGEQPLGLLALVARQLRQLVRVKTLLAAGESARALAGRLAVHPFVAQKLAEVAVRWQPEELHGAFRALFACDLALKSGGAQSAQLELGLLRVAGASAGGAG